MPQATPQQKLEVLARWRTEAKAAGHPVPSEDFIRELSAAGASALSFVEAEAEAAPWLPTLAFLIKQWKMSVLLPELPNHLKAPTSDAAEAPAPAPAAAAAAPPAPAPPTAPAVTPTDARFEALKAWRAATIESAPESVSNLKESHLRTISRTEFVTEAEVASSLPKSLSGLAGAIAEVLVGVTPQQAPQVETPPPTPPTPDAPVAASEPEPEPEGEPTAAAPRAQANDVDPTGFVNYDFTRAAGEIVALRGSGSEAGMSLTWDAYPTPDPVVLYRVVSSDQHAPFNPDTSDLVVSTAKTAAKDARPFASAVRYVQVWANSGKSVDEAKATQAVLHAQAAFVAPPRNIDIREDEGRVIGQWLTWPETTRVLVFRVPLDRAAQESGAPQHQILQTSDNLGGFVDSDEAIRGNHYLYQAFAEAHVDGVGQRAVPVVSPQHPSDIIVPVLDLVVTDRTDEDTHFDLTWTTPPSGQVVIYRTEQPPRPGADLKPLPESALAQAELRDTDRLAHPISRSADGTASMSDVPAPRDWSRAYFTPVTLLNGQSFVGASVLMPIFRPIRLAKVVERVNKQILTFEWPAGAASVFVYEGVTDQPAEIATQNTQAHEITQEQYVQQGGLPFPRQLPSNGCDIHLVPVTFLAGKRAVGTATTIHYPRLMRVRYDIKQLRNVVGSMTGVSVTVRSQDEMARPPEFVLVHNPDRMPLSKADGVVLTVAPESVEGSPPAKRMAFPRLGATPSSAWKTPAETWKSEVGKPRGYIRVFADLPPEVNVMLALVDPPPSSLRLESIMGKIGGLVGG